jgi:hypothetical protein
MDTTPRPLSGQSVFLKKAKENHADGSSSCPAIRNCKAQFRGKTSLEQKIHER